MRTSRASALLAAALTLSACSAAVTPAPTAAPAASATAAASAAAVKTPVVFSAAEYTGKLTVGLSNNVAINQFLAPLAVSLGIFQKYNLKIGRAHV